MTVAKAGSKWRAYIYDGGTAIATRTFNNPVDARAWERRMKRQLAAGIDVVGAVKKVQEWLPIFLEHRRNVVAASTLQRDEGICASLPAWLRAHRVCDVNPQVISRLVKSISGSPGTKQRTLITVAAFFSWLEGLAVVDRNPVRGIRIPRTNAIGAATNPFSWREVETMAPEGPYGDVIIALAYAVGERVWQAGRHSAQAQARAEGGELDLRAFHNRGIDLGSVGLDLLASALH